MTINAARLRGGRHGRGQTKSRAAVAVEPDARWAIATECSPRVPPAMASDTAVDETAPRARRHGGAPPTRRVDRGSASEVGVPEGVVEGIPGRILSAAAVALCDLSHLLPFVPARSDLRLASAAPKHRIVEPVTRGTPLTGLQGEPRDSRGLGPKSREASDTSASTSAALLPTSLPWVSRPASCRSPWFRRGPMMKQAVSSRGRSTSGSHPPTFSAEQNFLIT
jgi:hypothetical protein